MGWGGLYRTRANFFTIQRKLRTTELYGFPPSIYRLGSGPKKWWWPPQVPRATSSALVNELSSPVPDKPLPHTPPSIWKISQNQLCLSMPAGNCVSPSWCDLHTNPWCYDHLLTYCVTQRSSSTETLQKCNLCHLVSDFTDGNHYLVDRFILFSFY